MPPKPKFTKQEIINAAFEITREKGIEAVVARSVGQYLHTSSTPIFTHFAGMDELKKEVYNRASGELLQYNSDICMYEPAFLQFCLRWVRFASNEPNLYRLLFGTGNRYVQDPKRIHEVFTDIARYLTQEIADTFQISENNAEHIYTRMIIYVNGFAGFSLDNGDMFSDDYIIECFREMCILMVSRMKLMEGSYNAETEKMLADFAGRVPVKKNR